jgi:hypothetical protein
VRARFGEAGHGTSTKVRGGGGCVSSGCGMPSTTEPAEVDPAVCTGASRSACRYSAARTLYNQEHGMSAEDQNEQATKTRTHPPPGSAVAASHARRACVGSMDLARLVVRQLTALAGHLAGERHARHKPGDGREQKE